MFGLKQCRWTSGERQQHPKERQACLVLKQCLSSHSPTPSENCSFCRHSTSCGRYGSSLAIGAKHIRHPKTSGPALHSSRRSLSALHRPSSVPSRRDSRQQKGRESHGGQRGRGQLTACRRPCAGTTSRCGRPCTSSRLGRCLHAWDVKERQWQVKERQWEAAQGQRKAVGGQGNAVGGSGRSRKGGGRSRKGSGRPREVNERQWEVKETQWGVKDRRWEHTQCGVQELLVQERHSDLHAPGHGGLVGPQAVVVVKVLCAHHRVSRATARGVPPMRCAAVRHPRPCGVQL